MNDTVTYLVSIRITIIMNTIITIIIKALHLLQNFPGYKEKIHWNWMTFYERTVNESGAFDHQGAVTNVVDVASVPAFCSYWLWLEPVTRSNLSLSFELPVSCLLILTWRAISIRFPSEGSVSVAPDLNKNPIYNALSFSSYTYYN